MKKIYIVTRKGVYRHEIMGVYDTIEAADKRVEDIISSEDEDGYHSYDVGLATMNTSIEDAERLSWRRKVVK